ncbi:hypothetical protein [Micromonospora sp. MW-13]|uniref:hypothetical protein n=1 Tax=Micromonospora sp. MW-13 TaxID=2094022 RepID=UPI000FFF1020|nr:hypothetical protein [Micromonospora sp. MW-13]
MTDAAVCPPTVMYAVAPICTELPQCGLVSAWAGPANASAAGTASPATARMRTLRRKKLFIGDLHQCTGTVVPGIVIYHDDGRRGPFGTSYTALTTPADGV